MEDKRFDDLTRAVAGTSSRRDVVRRIAGVVGGGLLTAVGLRKTEAAVCRELGRPCRITEACCAGTCVRDRPNTPHGHCVCPPGSTKCGSKCCPFGAPTTTTTEGPTPTTSTTQEG